MINCDDCGEEHLDGTPCACELCRECGEPGANGDDSYDGLCPSCADKEDGDEPELDFLSRQAARYDHDSNYQEGE